MNEQPFNKLTPAESERLTKLAEECSEVIKTICKIQLHGFESVDPTGVVQGTNRQQLEKEIGDVIAFVAFSVESGDICDIPIGKQAIEKTRKITSGKCFLHHQQQING